MLPTSDEIDEALNAAYDQTDQGGSRWPGMSYEDGVIAAIEWMRGNRTESPMEDD